MGWIKMRCDLVDDPAVIRLASMLKVDRFAIVGRLHKFWTWADRHTVDGLVDWVDEIVIDELVVLAGFAKAMESVGWLELRDGAVALPKFDRHNGESAKKRADAAERKRKSRDGSDNHVTVMSQNSVTTLSQDSVTVSQKSVTREEKIREEDIKPPIPPKGGKAAISLNAYLLQCKADNKKPIAENDPVFDYAAKVGIPQEMLRLQWLEFKDRYSQTGAKRYKAWPTVFRKSVQGNWFRLWYATNDGGYALTTQGQQAMKAHKEAA